MNKRLSSASMAADEDDEDNWSEFTSLDSLEEGDLEEIQVRFHNCLM
jgi:hypothetical protein